MCFAYLSVITPNQTWRRKGERTESTPTSVSHACVEPMEHHGSSELLVRREITFTKKNKFCSVWEFLNERSSKHINRFQS